MRRNDAVREQPLYTGRLHLDPLHQRAAARAGEEVERERLQMVVNALPDLRQQLPIDLCVNPSADKPKHLRQDE